MLFAFGSLIKRIHLNNSQKDSLMTWLYALYAHDSNRTDIGAKHFLYTRTMSLQWSDGFENDGHKQWPWRPQTCFLKKWVSLRCIRTFWLSVQQSYGIRIQLFISSRCAEWLLTADCTNVCPTEVILLKSHRWSEHRRISFCRRPCEARKSTQNAAFTLGTVSQGQKQLSRISAIQSPQTVTLNDVIAYIK